MLCLVFILSLTGCGSSKPDVSELKTVTEMRAGKNTETETEETKQNGSETGGGSFDGGKSGFSYVEKMTIGDINDPEVKCEIYVPKGTEVNDGYGFYHEHGIYLSAYGNRIKGYEDFAFYFGLMLEYLPGPDMDYEDLYCSGLLENGDDRYFIYTGRSVQYDGTPFEIRMLEYMAVQPSEDCVNLSLQLIQEEIDEETDWIIEELEDCYGIELKQFRKDSILQEGAEYAFQEGEKELEAVNGYEHLGMTVLTDYDGGSSCPTMMPEGYCTNIGDSHAYSFLHGVWAIADVEEFYWGNILMTELKSSIDSRYELCSGDTERIRNVWKSAMLPLPGFEDAFYAVVSYEKKGYDETYTPRTEVLCYIKYDDEHYMALQLFLSGERYDEETDSVIRELERAYGMDLSNYYREEAGEKNGPEEGHTTTMAELAGGESIVKEEEALPDTVLWFNATYAPLTYSNGWNWKLVGGIQPTEENIKIDKYLLQQSWNVYDRESALDAVEWLKEEGHRETCRECMEEMKEQGLLELDEKAFQRAMTKAADSDKTNRYRIVYRMYQSGLDADDMAAWDLCRANQLYAAFYVCGYMSYEEAMDASLENSMLLQSMYDSWDEMMEGYLLGYRFWQGDLYTDENSPTQERRRMYEMMLQMEDNPYMLDWSMELKKSW